MFFEDNGHYYEVYGPMPFSDAVRWFRPSMQDASAYYQSHLLTISSVEERNFIHRFMGVPQIWIAASDATEEGDWRWVDGPEAGYSIDSSLWAPGMPRNQWQQDDYAMSTSFGWMDTNRNDANVLILEYEPQHSSDCKLEFPCRCLISTLFSRIQDQFFLDVEFFPSSNACF